MPEVTESSKGLHSRDSALSHELTVQCKAQDGVNRISLSVVRENHRET